MRKLNDKDLLYNTTYTDSRKQEIDIPGIVKGDFYTFIFDKTIVNIRDNFFYDDVQISYQHKGNTLITEHTLDKPSLVHHLGKQDVNVSQHGNNIYSGDMLSDNKSSTTFSKNKRCLAISVIPTPQYLSQIIEKDYPFSQMFYNEILGKSDKVLAGHKIYHADLNHLISKMIQAKDKNGFWEDMLEIWSQEYYLNTMHLASQPSCPLDKAKHLIEMKIEDKPTAEEISKELGISKRTLANIFHSDKTTFSEYKRSIIIKKAEIYMLQGLSPSECARKLGFSSLHYFQKLING